VNVDESKEGASVRVVLGDCLEGLRKEPDNSADAMITDPPAGISFLGKSWDSNRGDWNTWETWLEEIFSEALRVLKPGSHGLVWALPRTAHHTARAIEAAGFEIRDVISHLYGQGFPKNHSVEKALDRMRDDREEVLRVTAWIREARDAKGLTNADIDRAFGFVGMAGHWTTSKSQPAVPRLDQIAKLFEVLDAEPPEEIAALVWKLNGQKGKPGENWYRREVTGKGTAGFGKGSKDHGMVKGQSADYDLTAPASEEARSAVGLGTALKPAAEFWYLVRAPLERIEGQNATVARNFLRWGTGAINVEETTTDAGRWPANLVLSHAEGCEHLGTAEDPGYVINRFDSGAKPFGGAAGESFESKSTGPGTREVWRCVEGCPVREIDSQSGHLKTGRVASHSEAGIWGSGADVDYAGIEDGGGASRFFPTFRYVAKPSVREKSAGLSGKNRHPTAKPLDLCRWFVRLVAPKGAGRVVLDPFTGSGTIGVAAVAEGRSFLGFELDPEHVAATRDRIEHARAGFSVTVESAGSEAPPERAERAGQLSIFGAERKG